MTYSSFAIRDVTTDVRGDAGLVITRCSALFIMPFVTTYTSSKGITSYCVDLAGIIN
jgi:hypothetical protein